MKTAVKMHMMQPYEAISILATENYAGQRRIRERHVNYLANEINNERFKQGTQIHFAVCNGIRHLVNGQHTLRAIGKTQIPQMLAVQETQCANMQEVAELFAVEDRGISRTQPDVFKAFHLAENLEITPTASGMLTGAITFLVTDLTHTIKDRKPSPQEVIEFAEILAWRFHRYQHAVHETSYVNGKLRSYVIALALITAKHPKSFEFWNGYASDDGLRAHDPRKVFLNYNRNTRLSGPSTHRLDKQSVSKMSVFKVGVYCWNHFVSGKTIKALQIDKVLKSEGVQGTTFATGFGPENFTMLLGEQQ